VILGLNQETPTQRAAEVGRKWFTYPILPNAQRVFQQYSVRGIPVTFAINRDGKITSRHLGYRPGTEKLLEDETRKLLASGAASR
jgi:hypothetical protein